MPRTKSISKGGTVRSVYLNNITNELAVLVVESEQFPSFSAFIEECIVQHCGNLGYEIEPTKIVRKNERR